MISDFGVSSPSFAANLPMILDKLCMYDLEEHIDEVIKNIYHDNYEMNRQCQGIDSWNVHDVIRWVRTLKFLSKDAEAVAGVLLSECIDGSCLMVLSESDWTQTLKLDFAYYVLIRVIIQGWKLGSSDWHYSPQIDENPIGVSSGSVADLRGCDSETVEMLVDVDSCCGLFGVGCIYGQLVTLGYKEYQARRGDITPIGSANDIFVLQRRKVPNGIKTKSIGYAMEGVEPQSSTRCSSRPPQRRIEFSIPSLSSHRYRPIAIFDEITRKTVVLEYQADPTRDVFQVGRAVNGGNDFVVPGVLHVDDEGCTTGPISRWACRIESERLPPFRSFIYACGFDPVNRVIAPSRVHIPLDQNLEEGLDGFSTFGIKILQPEVGEWLEVSVRGGVFHTRSQMHDSPVQQVETDWGNQLTEGTLVDLGGVLLMFQSPVQMAAAPKVDPHSVIEHLNNLKPHCPVLFNGITFTYQDAQERIFQARSRAFEAGALTAHAGGIHVPVADYSDLNEENRPYVFPACGHIYAYHKSIESRPCPLCRQEGPFVPLAFTFEPSLCDSMPTHVFNPCGHIASHEACEHWSRLWVHSRDPSKQELVHICPYCAVELQEAPMGPPYSRLCLQTESGVMWPNVNTPRTPEAVRFEAALAQQIETLSGVKMLSEKYAHIAEDQALVATIRSQQMLFAREHQLAEEADDHQSNTNITRKLRAFPKYIPDENDTV